MDCGIGLVKEALLEKNENRDAIAGFVIAWTVDFLWSRVVGRIVEDALASSGSATSLTGDGRIPMLMGSDSPSNHFASLPAFSLVVFESFSPVRIDRGVCLVLVGDDWRERSST